MTTRDRAIADAARTDAKHRAAWTREQHKEAHAAVENRAALRLELDALGIDHYDRPALARIARIGALLIALGLESDPLEDAIGDSPDVRAMREELEESEKQLSETRTDYDKLIVERDKLREAARAFVAAPCGPEYKAAREALEELL